MLLLHFFLHNAFPRYLESGRDLLYQNVFSHVLRDSARWLVGWSVGLLVRGELVTGRLMDSTTIKAPQKLTRYFTQVTIAEACPRQNGDGNLC